MLETLKSLGIYRKRYADTFMTFYSNIDVLSLTRARHKTKKEKKNTTVESIMSSVFGELIYTKYTHSTRNKYIDYIAAVCSH